MKKVIIILCLGLFVIGCGSSGDENTETTTTSEETTGEATTGANPSYDPNRGEGKFKDVAISDKLDVASAAKGEKIAELKCLSCHKLTDEKLVGPGWAGVTTRHKPEWIMNFVTNTDAMIDKDPKVQAMLEICMVRMPSQNLSDDDARNLLEYMRKVDGVK